MILLFKCQLLLIFHLLREQVWAAIWSTRLDCWSLRQVCTIRYWLLRWRRCGPELLSVCSAWRASCDGLMECLLGSYEGLVDPKYKFVSEHWQGSGLYWDVWLIALDFSSYIACYCASNLDTLSTAVHRNFCWFGFCVFKFFAVCVDDSV